MITYVDHFNHSHENELLATLLFCDLEKKKKKEWRSVLGGRGGGEYNRPLIFADISYELIQIDMFGVSVGMSFVQYVTIIIG